MGIESPPHMSSSAERYFPVKRPLEELLFETPRVAIGKFSCHPQDEQFTDSGPSSTHCFVFPRTSVWIAPAGGSRFLSDPTIVTLYNEGQKYQRTRFSRAGDQCYWFAVKPGVAKEVATELGMDISDTQPFSRGFIRAGADLFVAHHRVLSLLRQNRSCDASSVEELVARMLRAILQSDRCGTTTSGNSRRITSRQLQAVEDARMLLILWRDRRVRLSDLTERIGCSTFYLCHAFRLVEGMTMHEYQTQLRLRAAVQRLVESPDQTLSELALDLGFSSHSHFSATFKRSFGRTPSELVSEMTTGRSEP